MECPNCRLENPPAAQQCECGHMFDRLQTRKCPFCAETIQAAAVKCRFCGEHSADSPPVVRPKSAPTRLLVLLALLVILVVANMHNWTTYGFSWRNLGFSSNPAVTVVTKGHYDRIQKGMTYGEVLSIIGVPGTELSRSDIAGYHTVMYAWRNSNGSNMNAMFQNGELIIKAQFGLQ